MTDLLNQLKQIKPDGSNRCTVLQLSHDLAISVYPHSMQFKHNACFFIGREEGTKYLWVASDADHTRISAEFIGTRIDLPGGAAILRCPMNHDNAEAIRSQFEFTRPRLIGTADSFGFGDRLGIANPAHVRAARTSAMRPVFAQQSIRELQRTQRKPEAVMDAATWAVLQEGYEEGFGADADHLKTTDDIDLMIKAGFTMFTFDPGEHVVDEADSLALDNVESEVRSHSAPLLGESLEELIARYADQTFEISDDFSIRPDREDVLRGLLKYGAVISHAVKLYEYLKKTYPDHPREVELSVDETASVTSPFEHFLVANELKRRDVTLVSLAPRFVGTFEKGIDYRGDLELFQTEYVKHLKIAEKLGPYKISFHSGSDKFTVYQAVGAIKQGHLHVKTAGTSYLEALRTVAATSPELFRDILDFARGLFEQEKKSYHVSAELERVHEADGYSDAQLLDLFEQDDARQVLHVTFGKVLTTSDANGRFLFRDRIMRCLEHSEETHYEYLVRHFRRHLEPLEPRAQ